MNKNNQIFSPRNETECTTSRFLIGPFMKSTDFTDFNALQKTKTKKKTKQNKNKTKQNKTKQKIHVKW